MVEWTAAAWPSPTKYKNSTPSFSSMTRAELAEKIVADQTQKEAYLERLAEKIGAGSPIVTTAALSARCG